MIAKYSETGYVWRRSKANTDGSYLGSACVLMRLLHECCFNSRHPISSRNITALLLFRGFFSEIFWVDQLLLIPQHIRYQSFSSRNLWLNFWENLQSPGRERGRTMPLYQTRTIAGILEPVAQQVFIVVLLMLLFCFFVLLFCRLEFSLVSTLIILHEEGNLLLFLLLLTLILMR